MDPELVEMLEAYYPRGTGLIRFRSQDGMLCRWAVGARLGEDNEDTLRAHLAKWKPGAEFLGWAIQ